jgi:hypothetical protein
VEQASEQVNSHGHIDTRMPTITVFVVSLSVLLFLLPILVIIALIGDVHLGPIHIDLSNRTRNTRLFIAVVGIGSWLALYIPLVSLSSRTMVAEISNSSPERIEVAAGKPTTASAFWSHPDLSFPSNGIVDGQPDEIGECTGGGHTTQYWLLPDGQTGWVQIDLMRNHDIVKLRWLNTYNGRCGGNRGTTDFHIAISLTGAFQGEEQTVYSGEMTYSQSPAYEETVLSPAVSTRYVRFYVDDYYGMGGGLNELEVYADE